MVFNVKLFGLEKLCTIMQIYVIVFSAFQIRIELQVGLEDLLGSLF